MSRATTNSRPPDRANEIERTDESNRQQLLETVADIDQTYRVNTSVFLQARENVPTLPFNAGRLLKNSRATLTFSQVAGIPYTPIRAASFGTVGNIANAADINSGRQPSTVQVFVNTGTCDAGLRDFNNRRVGNTGDATTSTAFDQPEFIGARRSIATGITVNF
jgi:hypothetical protein